MLERFEQRAGKVTLDFVRESSACVAANGAAGDGPWAPGRTLWHALYFPEERRVEVDFYLGETPDGGQRRSAYLSFSLRGEVTTDTK
ncbi:MAG: hypothetical protein GY711_25905 [bacterium]|nr:hypothetical protein [bacterium]